MDTAPTSHPHDAGRLANLTAELRRVETERLDAIRQLAELKSRLDGDPGNKGLEERGGNLARRVERLETELADATQKRDDHLTWLDEMVRAVSNPAQQEKAVPDATDRVFNVGRFNSPWETESVRPEEARGQALRAIELDTFASASARERATVTLERADDSDAGPLALWATRTSDPNYLTAFQKAMRGPSGHLTWTPREREAYTRVDGLTRAMSLADTSGGFMVPLSLDPAVNITNSGQASAIRTVSRNELIATDTFHAVNSDGIVAEWLSEGTEAADASPTLAGPSISIHKGSAFVPFSFEVGGDAVNFASEMARLLVDAQARLEGESFVNGTGSGQPFGVVSRVSATTASRVPAQTNNVFGPLDAYSVQAHLPARWRPTSTWHANIAIIHKLRQLATGAGPEHAFISDMTAGQPPQLLGRPLYECSPMDGALGSGDDDALLLGSFDQYCVVDRVGTTIELVPHLIGPNRRPTGQRGFLMWFRVGADTLTNSAFAILRV